jgi:hypothetical protein
MATDGTNLWVGGDFTSVNNKAQQGIAAFKPGDTRPFAPTVGATSPRPGQVVVSVRAPLDLDDTDLTIKVYRGSPTTGTLLQTSTVHSLFWKQPVLKVVDATPGTGTQTYSATATEVNAPNTVSPTGTTTVAVAATTPSYVNAVLATNPSSYWRLDDASSTIAADSSTASAGSAGIYSRTGARTPGATTVADNATTFAGTQDQYGQGSTVYSGNVVPATVNTATSSYSIEAWFKTTSTSGGEIIDFGNRPTALSSTFERNIYLDNAGHVIFGTWIGSPVTISSLAKAKTYNNGQWHHVVATQGTGGMALYVDNLLIGTNTNARHTSYAGYWRIGGDNLTNWPSKPTSQYLNGAIDEVAVYPTALTAAQVAAHWTAR